jgi:hypothetical protein
VASPEESATGVSPVALPNRVGRRGGAERLAWAGALLSLAIAVALFSRYGIDATLSRDESIYAYGGQQLAEGVPFYVSIFDVKTPLASQLAGLGAVAAGAVGANDLDAIRIVYFICACLAVVAMYVLGLWLWRSALAGLVAATTFAAFRGFAMDAIGGPNAKTPGVLFAVVSMALVARRRWFWAAFTGSLAFLVWQPLAIYAAIAVVLAVLTTDAGRRRSSLGRALAGASIPIGATTLYFWLAGALPEMAVAAFRFPVTGLQRPSRTLPERIDHIVAKVHDGYGQSGILFWAGLALLVALLVARLVRARSGLRVAVSDPVLGVVLPSLLIVLAFSIVDFEGYSDVYPGLPYAALGLGGAAAFAVDRLRPPARRAATAGALVAVAAVAGLSWSWYSADGANRAGLAAQRADASTIERLLDPGETLYALGDPTPLVLTGRRNPSRFIYLTSGVGLWLVAHSSFHSWLGGVLASHPAVIVVHGWRSPMQRRTQRQLRRRYHYARVYLGGWHVFVTPEVRARAARRGIVLRYHPAPAPG